MFTSNLARLNWKSIFSDYFHRQHPHLTHKLFGVQTWDITKTFVKDTFNLLPFERLKLNQHGQPKMFYDFQE